MAKNWKKSEHPILASLQDLVATESVNPAFPGGERGEVGVVNYLREFFAGCGIPTEEVEVLPGRSNIIATLEGENPGRVLLLECHMDVVAVQGMTISPFEPKISEGKLYGRGSCDTKAGGAAMMHAMKRFTDRGEKPPCTVLYAGTIDEESGFSGVLHLAKNIKADAAVVSEPTELKIVRTHKGTARFEIIVTGLSAHSSKPELGVNAITKMAKIILAIEEEIIPRLAERTDALTGPACASVGVITGGTQVNFVPDNCRLVVDRRMAPSENPDEVVAEFENLINRQKELDPTLEVSIKTLLLDTPMSTPENAEIVVAAQKAVVALEKEAVITGAPYGTDAGKLSRAGIPSIVLGPGNINQAHSAVEWVDCQQVIDAADIYEQIILNF